MTNPINRYDITYPTHNEREKYIPVLEKIDEDKHVDNETSSYGDHVKDNRNKL